MSAKLSIALSLAIVGLTLEIFNLKVHCVMGTDYDQLVNFFKTSIKSSSGAVVTEKTEYTTLICKLDTTTKICEAVAYRITEDICGASQVGTPIIKNPIYLELFDTLQKAFQHVVHITVNKLDGTVTFATLTHSNEVLSKFISSYTKNISSIDLTFKNKAQNISEGFLQLSFSDCNKYINSGALKLQTLEASTDIKAWLNQPETTTRMKNCEELNMIVQRLVNNYMETQTKPAKLHFIRIDGITGETEINTLKFLKLKAELKTDITSILKKLI